MNAITVLCLAAVSACSSSQLLGYPGVHYSYPGVLGAYPTIFPHPTPITYKNVAPAKVTFKTVAPAPITYKTVDHVPIAYKSVVPAPVPAPITYNVAPVAPIAPVTPVKSQYHAQDELGQYSFGYSGGPSSKQESRDAFGNVRGWYNYVDPEGNVQTQHYVADALGFRVAATNLPVAVHDIPEAVQDTPEVAEQKATLKAVQEPATETVSRKKRSVVSATPSFYSPLRFSYGFQTPLQYSYPTLFPNHFYNNALPNFATYPAFTHGVPAYSGVPAVTSGVTAYTAAAPGVTAYTAAAPGVTTYTAAAPGVTTYTAAAPAVVNDASLLKVVHNPGHATSYRVD